MGYEWIQQVLTGGIAGGVVTQGIMWFRERTSGQKKASSEHAFIAVDLVFRLERLAEQCADIVRDTGEPEPGSSSDELRPVTPFPVFSIDEVKGDWRYLPPLMMYKIHELPVRIEEARRYVLYVAEYNQSPPKHLAYFQTRHLQFADIGLRALYISRKLRKLCAMPESRLIGSEWSAWEILKKKAAEGRLIRYRQWLNERNSIQNDGNTDI